MPELLHPLFLAAGVGLTALPVVLHLLMRPRPRVLEFPAFRLLRSRLTANRRQLRLRHWLLLLLRGGLLALLGLALARPTVQSTGTAATRDTPVAAALVFDTQPRLNYRHDNQTRLTVAVEAAAWLLEQLPLESRAAVVDGRTANPVFQVDLAAAKQRLERLAVGGRSDSLWTMIERAAELLSTADQPKELYVFTDLTTTAWEPPAENRIPELLRAAGIAVYVIDVGVDHAQNFGLSPLRLSAQTLARQATLSIGGELTATGTAGQRTVEAYLVSSEGRAEKRAEATLDVPQDGGVPFEFPLTGLAPGCHQGYLRIVGGDALADDDRRHFTVQVQSAWRVLVVAAEPAESTALFWSEALAPQAFRKTGQARFEVEILSYDRLLAAPWETYSAVCLLDPGPLADDVWQRLGEYVRGGGGVGVFLGPAAQPLALFNSAAAREVLPAALALQARHPEGDVALRPETSEHPLLARFRPLAGRIDWDAFPVYRYWQLASPGDAGSATVCNYTTGDAAMVERALGRGRVVLMTTPVSITTGRRADERWNLLPTGFEPWPFVMLANETTLYLVGSGDQTFNFEVGATVVLRLQPEQRRPTFLLSPPEGASQRVAMDPNTGSVLCAGNDAPGNYRLEAGGESDGIRLGYSVDWPAAATRLGRLEPGALQTLFGDVRLHVARNRQQIERDLTAGRVGYEWFPWLIVALAIIQGLEHWLSNRFYRNDSAA